MSENMAWMRSKRLWMRAPKYCTSTEAKGSGTKAKSVSRGLMRIMNGSAAAVKTMVLAEYMMAGPRSWRTAFRSLVVRAMMSPVRWRWKKLGGWRSRLAKRSLRRSNSISREAPMMTWRVR